MAQEPSREVLELLLEAGYQGPTHGGADSRVSGVIIGVLVQCNESGQCFVSFDKHTVDTPIISRTMLPLCRADVGRQVCLLFENGDTAKPIIMGFIQTGLANDKTAAPKRQSQIEALIDSERIVLEGKKEIVLKCGKASITLKQDGKVLIRGVYLSSQASGPNLIKGGSVQLN